MIALLLGKEGPAGCTVTVWQRKKKRQQEIKDSVLLQKYLEERKSDCEILP